MPDSELLPQGGQMKRIVIIGAGQMGRALHKMLNPSETEFLCFGDNDASKWTDGEVVSVLSAVSLKPDMIIISVMGEDRARALNEQVKLCGYNGEVLFLKDIRKLFDIRSRCIAELAERVEAVKGAVAELGVYKGDTAVLLNGLFPHRELYLFDTFEGFHERDIAGEVQGGDGSSGARLSYAKAGDFADTSVEEVMERMPYPEQCIVCKGCFPETADGLSDREFALVSIDPDLYEPALAGLRFFYDRLNPGGAIVLHDYNSTQFAGIKKAVAKFEEDLAAAGRQPLKLVPLGDLHGSCVIIK